MAFQSNDPLKLTKINKFIGDEIWMHLIIKEKVIMDEWQELCTLALLKQLKKFDLVFQDISN